jgi:NADP-dependent 3-hydroxy acid dehydrogenase YdfG
MPVERCVEILVRTKAKVYSAPEKRARLSPGKLLQSHEVAYLVVHALSLPRTAEVTDISIRPMINS